MPQRPKSAKQAKDVDHMSMIRKILSKEPDSRTSNEIQIVGKYLKDQQFFSALKKQRDEKTYLELCMRLRLEEHGPDSIVFNYGEVGSHFYVIIEGKIDVRVPCPVELEEDSATPEGLISFIIMYFNQIYWKGVKRGSKALHMIYTELTRLGIEYDNEGKFDQEIAIRAIDHAIMQDDTRLHRELYNLMNPNNALSIEMMWFKSVNTLVAGDHFGELALQYHTGRGATIVTTQDTSLATLSQADYTQILGKEQRRQQKGKVAELRNYRIFSKLRPNIIAKLQHYMELKEFQRGQSVYKEGDPQINHVYFTINGEFEVTKSITKSDFDFADVKEGQTSIERKLKQSPFKGAKVKDMMRTRSEAKIGQLGSFNNTSSQNYMRQNRPKFIKLYLLGKNEVFGMEEVVDDSEARSFSVTCRSMSGACYVMSREHFQDCVNQFHFSDQVISELLLKHKMYKQRVLETHVFQQNFLKQQKEKWSKVQSWARQTEHNAKIEAAKIASRTNSQEIKGEKKEEVNNHEESKLELSSFLDVSAVMNSEYDQLHPRRSDTKVIQKFKKSMLDSAVQPMSWKGHKNKIQQS